MRSVSPWARRLEAGIVALLLVVAAALAFLEARSPVAEALREGKPLTGLLVLRQPDQADPALFMVVYHPFGRSLAALHLPSGEAAEPKGKTLLQLYRQGGAAAVAQAAPRLIDPEGGTPQPRFTLEAAVPAAPDSAPQFRRWVLSWPEGLSYWTRLALLARRAASAGLSPYEIGLLALEAYRLPQAEVRPVSWPAPGLRRHLASILLSPFPPPSDLAELRADVLNASGEAGIALKATKVLRLHRVDVIDYGNAPAVESSTRIVDRIGKPNDARQLARLLGCGAAEVWTELDPQASVPLVVVLGKDFRRCRRLTLEP